MTTTAPGVTIVILNWNGKSFLEQFLPSVLATDYPAFEVLVVDNASTDDSVAFVAQHYPQVRLLRLDRNYGFTGGNNRALPEIHTPYFVLLNSDVEVPPGWLSPMIAILEENPLIAAAQPRILAQKKPTEYEYAGAAGGWIDLFGYPFCRGRIFDTLEPADTHYPTAPVFWATGACLLLRTSAIERTGLFDEDFFAHQEELDLCWRLQNAGYQVFAITESEVFHVGGGTLPQGNPRKTFLNFRNNLLLMFKNLPATVLPGVIFLRMILDGVAAARMLVAGEFASFWAVFRAHLSFYAMIPATISKRSASPKPFHLLSGTYSGSIVLDYFIRKKKRFSELDLFQRKNND